MMSEYPIAHQHPPLHVELLLPPGRRVIHDATGLNGVVIDLQHVPTRYVVDFDCGGQLPLEPAEVRPVQPTPLELASNPVLAEAATRLLLAADGEPLEALTDTAVHRAAAPPLGVNGDADGRALLRHLDAMVRALVRRPCLAIWWAGEVLLGCQFTREPGYRFCGIHLRHPDQRQSGNRDKADSIVAPVTPARQPDQAIGRHIVAVMQTLTAHLQTAGEHGYPPFMLESDLSYQAADIVAELGGDFAHYHLETALRICQEDGKVTLDPLGSQPAYRLAGRPRTGNGLRR